MIIKDSLNNLVDIDLHLTTSDFDRKGIESCIDGFSQNTCSCCNWDIFLLDTFFDYFLENLQTRRISPAVVGGYKHIHQGQLAVHCLYNGGFCLEPFAEDRML
jgi:hypothetical protein